MNVLAIVWSVLVLGGLIPTSVFLYRFRPKWPIRQPSLVINGLVLLAWLSYLRLTLVTAARGWVPVFLDALDTTINLTLMTVADALLIALLVAFLKYRKRWQHEREKETGHESAATR